MLKYLAMAGAVMITSFYFFPFYFTFLPTVNTKMMVAACGVVVFLYRLGINRSGGMNKDFFTLSLWALAVSLASFISMTVNNTPDTTYMTYIVSMWVWLGGAYFVVAVIRGIHGHVSVEQVCFYLIAVCVLQCILAELVENVASVKTFVDSILEGEGYMGKNKNRLYGLGCALDVAGSRFAVVLVMVAFLLPRMVGRKHESLSIALLLAAFCIIAVIGNIIGRTATVGMMFAMAYILYVSVFGGRLPSEERGRLVKWLLAFLLFAVIVAMLLYNFSPAWKEQLRFGFEGFFSLVENGYWETHSNNMLSHQFLFPDNLRCWLIGDGYMENPNADPYYQGPAYTYYKGVDVGYSRFLFYFGLTGLVAFSIFILKVGETCSRRFKSYRFMFLMMLVINFIVWVKVSTDIFLCFAPFLCLSAEDEEEYNKMLEP